MSSSAQIPSGEIDVIISKFEAESSWIISPEAKTIILAATQSILVDDLGLGNRIDDKDRKEIYRTVMNGLRPFLDRTARHANNLRKSRNRLLGDPSHVIGGIIIIQNAQAWRTYMTCGCWPRDEK